MSQPVTVPKVQSTNREINQLQTNFINAIQQLSNSPTPPSVKTGNYTLLNSDRVVTFNPRNSNITATLPTAIGAGGEMHTIKNIGTGSGIVSIATTSGQTIDGRVSGDIQLESLRDLIQVQSDNANWIILNKKETKILSQLSPPFPMNVSGPFVYANVPDNSVTLTMGEWEVSGFLRVFTGTPSSEIGAIEAAGFFAANGNNTPTPPQHLTNPIQGTPFFPNDGISLLVGVSPNSDFFTSTLTFNISVTTPITVYLVPQTFYSTYNNSRLMTYIQAKRIW